MKKGLFILCLATFFCVINVNAQQVTVDKKQTQGEPTQISTFQQIVDKNNEALQALDNSKDLLEEALQTIGKSREEVDAKFINLALEVTKTLEGLEDKSELMSFIRKLKEVVKENRERYKDNTNDLEYWTNVNDKLKQYEDSIHQTRADIGEALGGVIKLKAEIYKKMERIGIDRALDGLGDLQAKLSAVREALESIKEIPDELKHAAPATGS